MEKEQARKKMEDEQQEKLALVSCQCVSAPSRHALLVCSSMQQRHVRRRKKALRKKSRAGLTEFTASHSMAYLLSSAITHCVDMIISGACLLEQRISSVT